MSATGKAARRKKTHRLIYVIILLKSFHLILNDPTSPNAINCEVNSTTFFSSSQSENIFFTFCGGILDVLSRLLTLGNIVKSFVVNIERYKAITC